MVRPYVVVCLITAMLSLVPWVLIALFSASLPSPSGQSTDTTIVTYLVVAALWLYPLFIGLFGYRSWTFFQEEDFIAAAGPATLIVVPAALMLFFFLVSGRPF